MKITVSITGQDRRRLDERTEQLVRARAANAQSRLEQDAPPAQSQPFDRRS